MRDKTHVTLDAFEQFIRLPENGDRLFELIDGEIVEKVTTHEHGILVIWISAFLVRYVVAHGGTISTETRHQLADDPRNARLPDLSYISAADLRGIVRQGAVPYYPTLVVEVKSPDDTYTALRQKALFYLEHGTRLVWLVLPERRTVEVYHANGDHTILTEADGGVLDGADVLPGFTLALADVFSQI